MPLKPHRFAELLPKMSDAEFASFKRDVANVGQQDPVIEFEGQILDGRHTYRACMELGRKPRVEKFKGSEDEALAFVYSRAVRRNMNESQKAAAAVRFLPLFQKAAVSRMKAGRSGNSSDSLKGEARDQAGALFGVSGRYVSDARLIFERDPKLFQKVFDGEEVISRAVRVVKRADRLAQAKTAAKSGRVVHPDDCNIIVGECVREMAKLPRRQYRLVFQDPPYNLGFKYLDDPTHDQLPRAKYLKMIGDNFEQASELLTADGALCVMICEEWVAEFKPLLVEAGLTPRRLIVWHEGFGQNGKSNFGRTCRFIWYAVKDPDNYVFDAAAILVESKRASHYSDKRAMPGGKVPDALWDFSRLCGTFNERLPDPGIPTQLPIDLVKRAIRCFTEPGDSVLDPFGGTGTTARASLSLGRKCTIIERSKRYARIIHRELVSASDAKES